MFFEVFQEHNDKCRELIEKKHAKATISRFDTCLKYFKEMLLKQYHLKDIPMKEINNSIIQDYIHFLKSKKNLQENTVIHYMKVVKKITNMALTNDWIDKNPFMNIHFHEQKVHKELKQFILEVIIEEFCSPISLYPLNRKRKGVQYLSLSAFLLGYTRMVLRRVQSSMP